MLDGILGRGFSAKCKSLMKTTRARIEVVRRRVEAKQRFLNEDLAKLLSNGLDINAYGRTEEFLSGMNLLCSYDFVEQSCEYILKQLSRMQKQGECPEECREAVASLMYAAARFSDMPELRELRDVFYQRYGNCLEGFVNQKLVEKLSSRPSPKVKRIQVLQDIASEFSIKWDSRGFERRMATPSIIAQVNEQKVQVVEPSHRVLDETRRKQSYGDHHISREKETKIEYRENSLLKSGGSSLQGNNMLAEIKRSYPVVAELNVERSNISSHGKILDNNVHTGYARHSNGIPNPRKGNGEKLFHEKANVAPSWVENLGKTENDISSYNSSNAALSLVKKGVDEESDRLKSCSGYALPPPYVKSNDNISRPPYVKLKEDKQKLSRDTLAHHHDCEEKSAEPKSHKNEKELDYRNEKILLPKPRSIRRKHHRPSSSSHNKVVDALEDVDRSMSSRRKDLSRKGMQIPFDEEHHVKDDEERMIDKLLMHYSKKPTSYEARKKSTSQPVHTGGEPSLDQSRNVNEVVPPPSRSVSLPPQQSSPPKVFARSNTFMLDNQARHVHPKLPDYDDLAARFAALKGR